MLGSLYHCCRFSRCSIWRSAICSRLDSALLVSLRRRAFEFARNEPSRKGAASVIQVYDDNKTASTPARAKATTTKAHILISVACCSSGWKQATRYNGTSGMWRLLLQSSSSSLIAVCFLGNKHVSSARVAANAALQKAEKRRGKRKEVAETH